VTEEPNAADAEPNAEPPINATTALRPTSLHLAAVVADWSPSTAGAEEGGRWRLFAGACSMVLLQSVTVLAVLLGTSLPRCAVSSHCASIDGGLEWFCTGPDADVLVNRCVYCPGAPLQHPIAGPSPQLDRQTGELLNDPYDERSAGRYNLSAVKEYCHRPTTTLARNWCDACVTPGSPLAVKSTTERDVRRHHVWAMGLSDWAALVLCTGLVALGVSHELHDIHLCAFVLGVHSRQPPLLLAQEPQSSADDTETGTVGSVQQLRGPLLGFIRHWVLLPAVGATVPFLVVMKGGDATDVCFNSVGTSCPPSRERLCVCVRASKC
jgi:hypothetical protein